MSKVSKKFVQTKTKTNPERITEKKAQELSGLRILQKNLVYVVGLSSSIAKAEVAF